MKGIVLMAMGNERAPGFGPAGAPGLRGGGWRGLRSLRALRGWLALLVMLSPAFASGGKAGVDGVGYENHFIEDVPWSVHVIKIERGRPGFELTTTLGGGPSIGLNVLTRQLRTIPRDYGVPLAAINGDFYALEHSEFPGDPRGLHIRRGELISDPAGRACLWIDDAGQPGIGEVRSNFSVTWPNGEITPFGLNEERRGNPAVLYTPVIGNSRLPGGGYELLLERAIASRWLPLRPGVVVPARVRQTGRGGSFRVAADTMVLSFNSRQPPPAEPGDVLMLSTASEPALKGVRTAMGGGPVLVRDGRASPGRASKAHDRHPRSAFGWNETHYYFVQVDGRQRHLSVGMTLRELADFLVKIGCLEAVNLDGGGSSQIWFNGKIMNSPCYGHERSTATALVLVQRKAE